MRFRRVSFVTSTFAGFLVGTVVTAIVVLGLILNLWPYPSLQDRPTWPRNDHDELACIVLGALLTAALSGSAAWRYSRSS